MVVIIAFMLQTIKHSIYRFNHQTPPNLPLAVRSSGSYLIGRPDDVEPPFKKWFSEFFWCEYGSGECRHNGKTNSIQEGDVFLLSPGDQHDLKPKSTPWKYHWFTLDHTLALQILKAFGIETEPMFAGPCPVELFEKLQECLQQGTIKGDREASHWAHVILLAVSEACVPKQSNSLKRLVDSCCAQIDAEYSNPNLDINDIAHQLNIHRSTLFRTFKQIHQVSPSRYLQNRRIERALKLLKETRMPIKLVAHQVGVPDANYFARSIRNATGLSPSQFRVKYTSGRGGVA